MRKLNLLLKIVTITLTFILISCSKKDPSYTQAHLVEVKSGGVGGIYFLDVNGFRLNPTLESISKLESSNVFLTEGISYIQYKIASDNTSTGSGTPTAYSIELLSSVSLDRIFESTDSWHIDDFAPTAPIICLGSAIESTGNMLLMNDRYLLMEVNYYFGVASDGKALPHDFTLVYNVDETTAESASLKLHLSHNNIGDTRSDYQSALVAQADLTLYLMAFDLEVALSHFKMITNKSEFAISVTADIASEYYQTIDDATQKEYLYNYRP